MTEKKTNRYIVLLGEVAHFIANNTNGDLSGNSDKMIKNLFNLREDLRKDFYKKNLKK